jgi:hypothetical protein
VLPEVLNAIFEFAPKTAEFENAVALLEAFIVQLDNFPTPWGLKFISEIRKITPASFVLPLSARRAADGAKLVDWFGSWNEAAIASVTAPAMSAK